MHAKQACHSVGPQDRELRASWKAEEGGESVFHQPGAHIQPACVWQLLLLSLAPCCTWSWGISDSTRQHRASGAKVSYLEAPSCLKGEESWTGRGVQTRGTQTNATFSPSLFLPSFPVPSLLPSSLPPPSCLPPPSFSSFPPSNHIHLPIQFKVPQAPVLYQSLWDSPDVYC